MKIDMKKLILLFGLTFFITHCGDPAKNGSGSSTCAANVSDTGLRLAVNQIGAGTYSMQLCDAASPPSSVTIYGGPTAQSLAPGSINTGASYRLMNQLVNSAGETFQVTFRSSDAFFAIYADTNNPDGTHSLSVNGAMVTPHPLPGK